MLLDHHPTVSAAQYRNSPEASVGRSSGLLGATFALLLILVITLGATFLGILPGIGNPEPGVVRAASIGWSIAGIVGIALVAFIAWAIAPRGRVSRFALVIALIALVAALAANVLVYLGRTAALNGDYNRTEVGVFLWLALLVLFVGPLATWLFTLITRSSARVLILVAAATAIMNLLTTLLFSINHLD